MQRQADLALGTFDSNRTAAPEGEQPGGRLPVDGDRSAYIPAVSLFPGAARIDPNIANPYEGDPEAVAAGERHYQAFNCAGCHAPLGGGGMGPPLSDDAWIHGGEPAQIYLSILHGRAEGMPAWGSMLPRRAIWELVSYVQSLSEIDDYATHIGFEPDPARRWGGTGSGQQQGAGQNDEDSRGGTGQGGVGQGGSGQGGSGQGGSGQGGGGGQSPGSQQQGSAGQADGP